MDRNAATFEAYDGVRFRLPGGSLIECEPITVGEAVRFLRLAQDGEADPEAHARFMDEFPARLGILERPVGELGFVGDVFAAVPYEEAAELVELFSVACHAEDAGEQARAQLAFLERFTKATELPEATEAAEVFAAGRELVSEFDRVFPELVRSFYSRPLPVPRTRATTTGAPSSTPDSTT